jgi:hypothetical protein
VFQRIAGAIDAWALAIPDTEHAIDLAVRVGLDLLRAEDRSCGEILVDGRQEFDVVLIEEGFGTPQFLVQRTERGSTVAGNEPGGI